MSIGQVAEIATMAWLGFFLKRLGWRTTMILGILGHVVRFGIYSIGSPDLLWLVILSNVVHGFAYAFFFATVYIFVDENFPKDVRTSAQSLFNLLILGLGPLVGNFALGLARRLFPHQGVTASNASDPDYHHTDSSSCPWASGLQPRRSWPSSSIPRPRIRYPRRSRSW